MTEFEIKSSLASSEVNPNFLIDQNTAKFEDEAGKSLISKYTYESTSLNITQFVNSDTLLVNETIASPILVFQYCIAGDMKLLELDGAIKALKGGDCLISILKEHNRVGFNRNCHNTIVSIQISLEYALRSFDERVLEKLMLPPQINNRPIEFSPFLPRERMILSEIVNPPVTGSVKKLFIESKMLELMAIRLSYCYEKTVSNPKSRTLSFRKEELERIRFAGEVVAERMDDPPSISQLARISGINEFKLKAGFKVVFGATIYEYIRALRMEKAYALLHSGEMNVSEVAYHLGYRKAAHFSKLFQKCYGINPGQIKKYSIE